MKRDEMGPERSRLTELREAYTLGREVRDLAYDDLVQFYRWVGLHERLAKEAAASTLGHWNEFDGGYLPSDFRTAVSRGIASLPLRFPDIMFQEAPGGAGGDDGEEGEPEKDIDHGPRPLPEVRQTDPVVLDGHGTVRRGTITRDSDGNAVTPHVYIWLEQAAESECREYGWYQFVHPSLWIGTNAGALEDKTGDLSGRDRRIEANTGLKVEFCSWNPDYQKNEIEERERQGGEELPTFEPDTEELDGVDEAKPYTSRPIPNEDGRVGLVDAPDWLSRQRDDDGNEQPSPIERMWKRPGRRNCVKSSNRPPDGSEVAEIRMEFQSYLVCLDDGECIGYLEWTAVQRATISYGWFLPPDQPPPESGITTRPKRKWCTSMRISGQSYELEIGDWHGC